MSKKYIYQKFLLNCPYEKVDIDSFPCYCGNLDVILDYGKEYCVFDIGKKVMRKVDIRELDCMVDTAEDWNRFIESLSDIDSLVIYGDYLKYTNPIISQYRKNTLCAYLYRLQESEIATYLALS